MFILKDYQEEAVSELISKSNKQLKKSGNKTMVFKSPTGSGKTIMMAEYLKRLIDSEDNKNNLSFIWAAPRKLHDQSKGKLESFYKNCHSLKCSFFFDLNDKQIGSNEILFINWESINKEKNLIIKENEREFFLSQVIKNSKQEGRNIILIIDESHFSATSNISKNLIQDISPKLTIEVSATPTIEGESTRISVDIDDVKEEGMIKKSVIFQEGYVNKFTNSQLKTIREDGSDFLVLEDAIKKRAQIHKTYQKIGSDINPLLLIQLPDRKTNDEDIFLEKIIKYLDQAHSITADNNKLAIYLSGKKVNLTNISKNNNEVEVLIFKQAIALGWDCPRASILVLFRNWKSINFSIQTIGRIMRMPEPNIGHYQEEMLNHAYFYTNLDDIKLADDYSREYLSICRSVKNTKTDLLIESCHRLRRRDKTRLNTNFIQIFLDSANQYNLKSKLRLKNNSISQSFVSELEIDTLDDLSNIDEGKRIKYDLENKNDIQKLFDLFSIRALSPDFFPEKRSIKKLNYSIYKFFELKLKIDFAEDLLKISEIVLDDNNIKHFLNVTDLAKTQYIKNKTNIANKLIYNRSWDIPDEIVYSTDVNLLECNKAIMSPFYCSNLSKPETAFIDYLENSNKVSWWFKNGERDSVYFALPYSQGEEQKPFYVDFIIYFKNKKIGFFDTKSGITITEAFASGKIEGLNQFLNKNEDHFGGIITNTEKDNSGIWKYFSKKTSQFQEGNIQNWDIIDF